jgi:hypothetical protein
MTCSFLEEPPASPTPMVASMVSAMHLPTSESFAAFAAQLKAYGSDLAAGLRALAPALTTAEKAARDV